LRNSAGYGFGMIKAFQRKARYSLSRGNQTVGQVISDNFNCSPQAA
jgi:hypothetical protein